MPLRVASLIRWWRDQKKLLEREHNCRAESTAVRQVRQYVRKGRNMMQEEM